MSQPLIPISAVEGLMKKAFLEKAVAPGLFWDALLKANLYVPLSKEIEQGQVEELKEAPEGEELPMVLGLDADNKNVVWLFTSPAVLNDYIEQKLPTLELPATKVFSRMQTITYEVVLIGPDGLTLSLHPELIKTLAEGKSPDSGDQAVRYVPKEAQVYVGAPKEMTGALETKFSALFKTLPNVLEASFIQIADEAGSRLLLGLRLQDESRENLKHVTELVAKAAEGSLEKGKSMDITFIGGSLKEAFKKWGKSFYLK